MTAITLLLELLAIYLRVLSPLSLLSFHKYLSFLSKCQVGSGVPEMKDVVQPSAGADKLMRVGEGQAVHCTEAGAPPSPSRGMGAPSSVPPVQQINARLALSSDYANGCISK